MMYSTGISEEPDAAMRTTLNLDEELLARAHELTGIRERTMLLHEGLRLLIQREAARRLARLGGTMPALAAPRRRKSAKRRP
jgi:Arc/MetJ family transcription regulator